MDENVHIIWGNSSFSKNRINVLKMNGMKKIIVLDDNQASMVKEKNDVFYFSLKYAPLIKKDMPGKIHHFFMNVSREQYENRKKLDFEE